ncbi:putative replication-associated protein 1 [Cyclovirus roach]|uniref:Replication-associated protein 1 n=1 Tax=Cyclovirus roach TaxID=3052164 RepID=L7WUM1_9CIRC|nr:putative replication-associated protein 1 [Cyclovirus roach]AGC84159.1 putative replication-associated protein 1 [Cyclovirus roach]
MNSVVRRFVFTLNNYSEEQYVRAIDFLQHYCKYGVVGKETGESGTPHLQGFCNLKKQMRFNTIKAKLDNAIHLEKANGSDTDNQKYCTKSGDYFETGTPSGQGTP